MENHGKILKSAPVVSGIKGKCPECGKGHLFTSWLTLAKECDHCGLDLSKADTGDGPAIFVMTIVGFVVVGLALWVEIVFKPSYWIHAALWLPLTFFLSVGLLRPFKGWLAAAQFYHKAEEAKFD